MHHILSIAVLSEKNHIKIEGEQLKREEILPKGTMLECIHICTESECLWMDGFEVNGNNFQFQFHENNVQHKKHYFSGHQFCVTLPKSPPKALSLLKKLQQSTDRNEYDLILLDKTTTMKKHLELQGIQFDSMTHLLKRAYPFGAADFYQAQLSLDEFQHGKEALPNNPSLFLNYLIDEIIKIDPITYSFLILLKNNLSLTTQQQETILNNTSSLILYDDKPEVIIKFLTKLYTLIKFKLIQPCINKKAPDGGEYHSQYTELKLLTNTDYTYRKDGRLSIVLKDNPSYKKFYATGKKFAGQLKEELEYLSPLLDLEFAEDSNFNEEIIFTKKCSASLISQGLLFTPDYLKNYFEQHVSSSQFQDYAKNKQCAKNVFYAIEPFFKHLNIISEKALELKNRGYECEAQRATHLVQAIKRDIKIYIDESAAGNIEVALNNFKEKCTIQIQKEIDGQLGTHRGYKSALCNLLISVSTLFVANITHLILTKGKHGFFTFYTDSSAKLKDMEETTNKLNLIYF